MFLPYASTSVSTAQIEQSSNDVVVSVQGKSQHVHLAFSTPADINPADIEIANVVVPEGATSDVAQADFKNFTPSGRKLWDLRVYYYPSNISGTTTFTMTIKGEVFNISMNFMYG